MYTKQYLFVSIRGVDELSQRILIIIFQNQHTKKRITFPERSSKIKKTKTFTFSVLPNIKNVQGEMDF